jgi:T5SS/PEP-CTERM-associated repeat protein
MPLPAGTKIFTGAGQSGNWADPLNWANGRLPVADAVALIPVSTTMNGGFSIHQLMLLGNEAVTVNGVINIGSANLCTAFMVCADAVATFTPGAALNDDLGGLVVGNISTGTLIAKGNATTQATLTSAVGSVGKKSDGTGTVTIDGAHWNNAGYLYVGQEGNGTLNVENNGLVNVGTNLIVGVVAGATGSVTLSSGGDLTTTGALKIGESLYKTATDGTGQVSVGAGSTLTIGGSVQISGNGALSLAGGLVSTSDTTLGVQIAAGATISGYGTASSTGTGFHDRGVITASGGTLVLNGVVNGSGAVQIAAGSTLQLTADTIGGVQIAFLGSAASLDLPHGFADDATIHGFGSGDSIVLAGAADALSWNAHSDVLSVSSAGEVVDTLRFAGTFAANPFTLSQTSAGAIITLSSHN